MKILIYILFPFFFLVASSAVYGKTIGKVTLSIGEVSSRNYEGASLKIAKNTPVIEGQLIILGRGAGVELNLNDGTFIWIYGPARLTVESCRVEEEDPPTRVRVTYGKIKVASKSVDNTLSLQIITPSAEISAVMSELYSVVSRNETAVAVYKYKAAVASSKQEIKEAYIVYPGEESRVFTGRPPAPPVSLSSDELDQWLDSITLSPDKREILLKGDKISDGESGQ